MNHRRHGVLLVLVAALGCSNANDAGAFASGNNTASAQARCEKICATVAALHCPNASPQATCVADCGKVAAAPTACPSELAAYYQCAADAPGSSWECDAQGKANPKSGVCATQLAAWQGCAANAGSAGASETPGAGY